MAAVLAVLVPNGTLREALRNRQSGFCTNGSKWRAHSSEDSASLIAEFHYTDTRIIKLICDQLDARGHLVSAGRAVRTILLRSQLMFLRR